MFDLEQAFAQWRRQMLAAGIKAPVPLDELEAHLREEIERQIHSGASEQEAFQRTVLQIGQAKELKAEFAKELNLLSLLGNDKFTRIDRILGTLWLINYSFVFVQNLTQWESLDLLSFLVVLATCGPAISGSVLVIRGKKLGRWVLGITASLYTLVGLFTLLALLLRLLPIPSSTINFVKTAVFAAFYAITVWLMFRPSFSKIKPARA